LRDIEERAQRAWREERIAAAPEHTHRLGLAVAEPADQSCFPDAGLAPNEHQSPSTTGKDGSQRLFERGEVSGTLEQFASWVRPGGGWCFHDDPQRPPGGYADRSP
jgi:hypothetical protein